MADMHKVALSLASHNALVFGLKAAERFVKEGVEVTLVMTQAAVYAAHSEFGFDVPVNDAHEAHAALVEFLELSKLEERAFSVLFDDDPYSAVKYVPTFDALVICPASTYALSDLVGVSDKTATSFIGNELLGRGKPVYALLSETALSQQALQVLSRAAQCGIALETCVPNFASEFDSVDELINNTVFGYVERIVERL